MRVLICRKCKNENPTDWICQHATKESQWRSATLNDVGLCGRFCDRDGDDWTYGMLVGIVDGVFQMIAADGESAEPFFYCEIHA
jgi:hypothetical protein